MLCYAVCMSISPLTLLVHEEGGICWLAINVSTHHYCCACFNKLYFTSFVSLYPMNTWAFVSCRRPMSTTLICVFRSCVVYTCDHSWSFVQTPKTEMKHMAQSGNMIWPKEWASCIWIWSGCVAAAATSDRGWYVVSGQMCSFHCMLTPSSFIELNISKWIR